jgi:hypothetical protein
MLERLVRMNTDLTFITERTRAILAAPDSSAVPRLEAEVNRLVYALYNVTPEEIGIIEKV